MKATTAVHEFTVGQAVAGSIVKFQQYQVSGVPAPTTTPGGDFKAKAATCLGNRRTPPLTSKSPPVAPVQRLARRWPMVPATRLPETIPGNSVFKVQGGSNGWALVTGVSVNAGTFTVRGNRRNQVITWLVELDSGETLSIDVTVAGADNGRPIDVSMRSESQGSGCGCSLIPYPLL